MSEKRIVSRRAALSIFGIAAGAISVAAPAGRASGGQSNDPVTPATSTRRQYIFGYGSLIDRQSRIATWPSAKLAWPAVVHGIARGWFDQTDVPSWSPTYLGGMAKRDADCNGVIFPVTAAELASYIERETGYQPTRIEPSQITMLGGSSAAPSGDIWYFASTQRQFPCDEHPIVQSYVDLCLDGCLEIEAQYPLAKEANFAERFIRTTSYWGPPWINDRIYPWRPFVYMPRAFAIDALIRRILGDKMFARITLG